MISTIIIFILVLSLLVFVHEFGHFTAAKKIGVKVEEFGIGFPPRAFSIKKGDTVYSLNWIPIGGFVRLKGEDGENKEDADSFASKKIWQKIVILASGVVMNFVLAAVVLSIGFAVGFPQAVENLQFKEYAKISDSKINILSILDESPAKEAGIIEGDVILNIDGNKFETVEAVQNYIKEKRNKKMVLSLIREDEVIQKEITAMDVSANDEFDSNQKYGIGVGLIESAIVRYPVYIACYQGVVTTVFLTKEIFGAFGGLIKNFMAGQSTGVDFAGPVGIAAMTGKFADLGFVYLLQFIALLSINLGIINFFPFPALDGGRTLFLIIEKIRGKAVKQDIENMIHNIGFVLLILLLIVITFKDVMNYRMAIMDFFKSIF